MIRSLLLCVSVIVMGLPGAAGTFGQRALLLSPPLPRHPLRAGLRSGVNKSNRAGMEKLDSGLAYMEGWGQIPPSQTRGCDSAQKLEGGMGSVGKLTF